MVPCSPWVRTHQVSTVCYLRLVQPLLAIGHLTPDDGSDVLDDHGALLDVPGGVQTQTLKTDAVRVHLQIT